MKPRPAISAGAGEAPAGPAPGRAGAGRPAWLAEIVAWLSGSPRSRLRQMAQLHELDDRMLRDIGLNRWVLLRRPAARPPARLAGQPAARHAPDGEGRPGTAPPARTHPAGTLSLPAAPGNPAA